MKREAKYYSKPGTSGVYGLADPRNNRVRYIGSSVNIEARCAAHIKGADTNTRKLEWIYELRELGLVPTVVILVAESDAEKRKEAEAELIALYEVVGDADLNIHHKKESGYAKLREKTKRLEAEIRRLQAQLQRLKR